MTHTNQMTLKETMDMFNRIQQTMWVPSWDLSDLTKIVLNNEDDFKKLPKENCAYWIGTNEPVHHAMFNNKNFPKKIGDIEIIYNGITKNLRSRAKEHLLRKKCAGNSGISIDLYTGAEIFKSHVKTAFTKAGDKKTPFIKGKKPNCITDLLNLHLSMDEQKWLKKEKDRSIIQFWNGINVTWPKHKQYTWVIYYHQGPKIITDNIENAWREKYGKPRLCSYNDGR